MFFINTLAIIAEFLFEEEELNLAIGKSVILIKLINQLESI